MTTQGDNLSKLDVKDLDIKWLDEDFKSLLMNSTLLTPKKINFYSEMNARDHGQGTEI